MAKVEERSLSRRKRRSMNSGANSKPRPQEKVSCNPSLRRQRLTHSIAHAFISQPTHTHLILQQHASSPKTSTRSARPAAPPLNPKRPPRPPSSRTKQRPSSVGARWRRSSSSVGGSTSGTETRTLTSTSTTTRNAGTASTHSTTRSALRADLGGRGGGGIW